MTDFAQHPYTPVSTLHRSANQARSHDQHLRWVLGIAVLVALTSFLICYSQGWTSLYFDGQARLMIARRVVDSPTPGLGQLGGVWPPLTHFLAIPLIGNDFLYQSGIALSIYSMLAFVVSSLFIYWTLVFLTNDRGAGILGALMFMGNPGILYMQTTPMTELPLYLAMIASVYFLLRIGREPENLKWVVANGICNILGCLVRYEMWILVIIELLAVLYIYAYKRFSPRKIEGYVIYWCYWAFAGIVLWMIWNWIIFGDPLAFQRGEYARPSLWVFATDPVIGDITISFLTYLYATIANVGPLFFIGLIGAVYYAFHTRFKPEAIGAYTILGLFPAFVFMLYAGQRPMKAPELSDGAMYNTRFALVMVIPSVIFVAYLARGRWFRKAIIAGVVIASNLFLMSRYGVMSLNDPLATWKVGYIQTILEPAPWFQAHYDGRTLLIEGFGNEGFEYLSRIPLRRVIYEGSYRLWEKALADPAQYADWIFMRARPAFGDKVWQRWHSDPYIDQYYQRVFANSLIEIYQRRIPLDYDPIARAASDR